jgi:hypothetical protein
LCLKVPLPFGMDIGGTLAGGSSSSADPATAGGAAMMTGAGADTRRICNIMRGEYVILCEENM